MRTKIDCLREIDKIERKIKSNRKCADTTANKKSAAILDATLPALERRLAELRAELPTLPDVTPREFVYSDSRSGYSRTDFSDNYGSDLEIPTFLRRNK
jgi:hypothetical protein